MMSVKCQVIHAYHAGPWWLFSEEKKPSDALHRSIIMQQLQNYTLKSEEDIDMAIFGFKVKF
jgi:hypothetical protein